MKKCPFCAEEIKDEAIKCRFCGSFLSAAPGATPPAAGDAPVARPAPFHRDAGGAGPPAPEARTERKTLYDGAPSWRVYLGLYVYGVLAAALILGLAVRVGWPKVGSSGKMLLVLVPLSIATIYFAALHLYRRSIRFRVTTSNIEIERGVLTKRIEVVELWRCRDVRYKQSLVDRMLGIAHIEIISADVTTPVIEMIGLPASRKLFEQLRDSIEIQRQSKNVYGVVS